MNTHSTNGVGSPRPRQFFPPSPCPPGTPCGSTVLTLSAPSATRAHERGKLAPEKLANTEAARLIAAAAAAEAELAAAEPQISAAVRELARRAATTAGRLDDLAAFAAGRDVAAAYGAVRDVRERHAQEGAEDRRRKPAWVRWLTWPTVVAAALYDTWFFSGVFRGLLDASDSPGDPGFWLSLMPGVMLTVGLLVTAQLLATAIVRARAHGERRPTRIRWRARRAARRTETDPVPEQRSDGGLPWPRWWGAVLFGVFVVGTLGWWAVIRAETAVAHELNPDVPDVVTPPLAVAVLLLLFSCVAIAIKVCHYNPYADSDREARAAVRAAEQRRTTLSTAVGEAITDQESALADADALLGRLRERAYRRLDEAMAELLRERAGHGLAGDEAPRFADAAGRTDGRRVELFEEIREPSVDLGPVVRAHGQLTDYAVDQARARAEELRADLIGQATGAPDHE